MENRASILYGECEELKMTEEIKNICKLLFNNNGKHNEIDILLKIKELKFENNYLKKEIENKNILINVLIKNKVIE